MYNFFYSPYPKRFMSFFNLSNNKLQYLVRELYDVDKRKRYSLHIATCYFSVKSAFSLLNSILHSNINITKVTIYIDRKEAIRCGVSQLYDFAKEYSNVRETNIYAVRSETLFHTKGYCLLSDQYSSHAPIYEGKLTIGSANLSGSGLTDESGNIESMLCTTDENELRKFTSFFLDETNLISIDKLMVFDLDDDLQCFKYAVLLSGWFSHKWTNNLDRYFRVRYILNEEGKRQTTDEDLRRIGFDIDAASIGKRYLDFDFNWSKYKSNVNVIKDYGIESSLGHWVPKSVISTEDEGISKVEKFRSDLKSALQRARKDINKEIKSDYDELNNRGIIETVSDPVERFWSKVSRFVEDDIAMNRIMHGRSFFDFPFDHVLDAEMIDEIFDQLISGARGKKAKNKACRTFLSAYEQRSVSPIVNLRISKAA